VDSTDIQRDGSMPPRLRAIGPQICEFIHITCPSYVQRMYELMHTAMCFALLVTCFANMYASHIHCCLPKLLKFSTIIMLVTRHVCRGVTGICCDEVFFNNTGSSRHPPVMHRLVVLTPMCPERGRIPGWWMLCPVALLTHKLYGKCISNG